MRKIIYIILFLFFLYVLWICNNLSNINVEAWISEWEKLEVNESYIKTEIINHNHMKHFLGQSIEDTQNNTKKYSALEKRQTHTRESLIPFSTKYDLFFTNKYNYQYKNYEFEAEENFLFYNKKIIYI